MKIEFATYIPEERAGEEFRASKAILEQSGPDVAWNDRQRIVLDIDPESPVQDAVVEAVRALGIFGWEGGGFARPIAFASLTSGEPVIANVQISDEGFAEYTVNMHAITYRDIERAVAAGVFPADLNRAYLMLDMGYAAGGGAGEFWGELLRTLPQVALHLETLGAVYGGVRAVTDVVQLGYRTMVKMQSKWLSRRVEIKEIKEIVAQPKTLEQAARLLGVDEVDAKRTLEVLGLAPQEDGTWRTAGTDEGELLRLVVTIAAEAAELNVGADQLEAAIAVIADLPALERFASVAGVLQRVCDDFQSGALEPEEDYVQIDYEAHGRWTVRKGGDLFGMLYRVDGYVMLAEVGVLVNAEGELLVFDDHEAVRSIVTRL